MCVGEMFVQLPFGVLCVIKALQINELDVTIARPCGLHLIHTHLLHCCLYMYTYFIIQSIIRTLITNTMIYSHAI
jgi:hypothetical protein